MWCSVLAPFAPESASSLRMAQPRTVRLPLLKGRLLATLPVGVRITPRAVDIMSAPETAEAETRVILDSGRGRFVILCRELFRKASNDFASDARSYASQLASDSGKTAVRPILMGNTQLRGFVFVPLRTGAEEPILVQAALIQNRDGALQDLRFYVDGKGRKNLRANRALSDRCLRSVTAGRRLLALGKRRVLLKRGQERAMQLDLSDG